MPEYLLYNGSFHRNDSQLVTANNRGLRYGDGLFETLRIHDNSIYFRDWHFERLFQGLGLLGFELPADFTAQYLHGQVKEICRKNLHSNARVRITIFRGDGGLYDPANHIPNCIIQSWPLEQEGYRLNENGLVTGIYSKAKKSMDTFANIKTNSHLPYVMAALYTKKQQWNDAFLLNSLSTICDATIANVFIVKKGIVFTPPLTDGCIAGIMRRFLVANLPARGFECREVSISTEDLLNADEVFVSNVIRGIRWVRSCADAAYGNNVTTHIQEKLLKNLE